MQHLTTAAVEEVIAASSYK